MNCPRCNKPGAEPVIDEVDIGVGIQSHVLGWECPECGQIAACSRCGGAEPSHAKWCRLFDRPETDATVKTI